MNKSIIKVLNIFIEDLFKWFSEHILDSGGDGCGAIVCKNYKETANQFLIWFSEYYSRELRHPRDIYDNIVNFHDSNENFIFTDIIPKTFPYDYIFIIEEDCKFADTNDFVIKAIK